MTIKMKRLAFAMVGAGVLAMYGCGGGGGTSDNTTTLAITVIDGPIQNATVCLDKNKNGMCDVGEPFAKTDSKGMVNLTVDVADVGKYPVIALVGTDAVDVDHGPVTTAFTLKAPADQTAVITPLTTLVQDTVESVGVSSDVAESLIREQTGINISLFQDFTTGTTEDHKVVAIVARMLVVTTQEQLKAVAAALGTVAADGTIITQAALNKAVSQRTMDMLPAVLATIADPSVTGATGQVAQMIAFLKTAGSATGFFNVNGLTAASVGINVAINNQATSTAPVATATPSAGFSIRDLDFTDGSNFYFRVLGASLAQDTPDASNNTRYVERRYRASSGALATWSTGKDPSRNSDLHWSGTAWANCPINFENTTSVRDAFGNSAYNYCGNLTTGKSNRATFDVSGKSMATTLVAARAAGYTNLSIGDNTPTTLTTTLGAAAFPAGSSLYYQTNTPLTYAVAYYPGTNNRVTQYGPAVSAGGVASNQPAGTGCNAVDANITNSTSLEGMMATMTGTPCVYGQRTFVYRGVTYTSDPSDEAWNQSTVSMGTVGTAPVGTGTAPGFYTGNTRLRVAFKGAGANPVTYYACKERFNDGSARNCTVIGTGSYTIETLGDASRIMKLNNLPSQATLLGYSRVFVERGGYIYYGHQVLPIASNLARLNTAGTTALLTQLGLTAVIPDFSAPLTTTVASYAGTYRGSFAGTNSGSFSTVISAAGVTSCSGTSVQAGAFSCNFTVTPTTPSTAAIRLGVVGTGAVFTGVADFHTGTVSGNWTNGGASGTFTGSRL